MRSYLKPLLLILCLGFLVTPHLVRPASAQEERPDIPESDRQAEANRIERQGTLQLQNGQYEDAVQSWQEALEIYRQINDRTSEAALLMRLGYVLEQLGRYQQASNYFQRLLLIAQSWNDRDGEANVLNDLGNIYRLSGQYQQAIDCFQQALRVYQSLNQRGGEASVLSNLGTVYAALGQDQQAIDFLQRSVEASEAVRAATQDPSMQRFYTELVTPVYRNLADLLQQQSRSTEAQAVLDLLR